MRFTSVIGGNFNISVSDSEVAVVSRFTGTGIFVEFNAFSFVFVGRSIEISALDGLGIEL